MLSYTSVEFNVYLENTAKEIDFDFCLLALELSHLRWKRVAGSGYSGTQ